MISDYPAAHSMDTDWFAIDADGNVALFDSGEDGAVPETYWAVRQYGITDCIDLFQYLPHDSDGIIRLKTPAETVIQGLTLSRLQESISSTSSTVVVFTSSFREGEISFPEATSSAGLVPTPGILGEPKSFNREFISDLLLVFSNENSIHKLTCNGEIFRFAGDPIVALFESCSINDLEQLIESCEISAGQGIDLYNNYHVLGLFTYKHNKICASPYDRTRIPTTPLHLNDLPTELQDLIIRTKFETLLFHETQQIQPIEHTKCHIWGLSGQWIDTQGQSHNEQPF